MCPLRWQGAEFFLLFFLRVLSLGRVNIWVVKLRLSLFFVNDWVDSLVVLVIDTLVLLFSVV